MSGFNPPPDMPMSNDHVCKNCGHGLIWVIGGTCVHSDDKDGCVCNCTNFEFREGEKLCDGDKI